MSECIMCYDPQGELRPCGVCETRDEYHKVCYKCSPEPCQNCGLVDCRDLTFNDGLCSNCACDGCKKKADYICENKDCYFVWCNVCNPKRDCELCKNLDVKIHNYVCGFCGKRETCFKCNKSGPLEHFEVIDNDGDYDRFNMCEKCRNSCYECDASLENKPKKWKCYGGGGPCSKIFCGQCKAVKIEERCYECYKESRGP